MKKSLKHLIALIFFIAIDFAVVFALYYIGVLALKLGFPGAAVTAMGERFGTFYTGLLVIGLIAGFSFIGFILYKALCHFYLWIFKNIEKEL